MDTVLFGNKLENVRKKAPIVHCITNFVTVNDCANIVLACGAAPTMAHHEKETAQITSRCDALVLNMGNVHNTEAMILAGRKSNELQHPVILDPVGIGGSDFRRETFQHLSENFRFDVIRGNASEIKCIATGVGTAAGVDASKNDVLDGENIPIFAELAKKTAEKFNCVIVISGKTDIVASKNEVYLIKNGCAMMSRITGTGCMLTSLIGAYCGANKEDMISASVAAVAGMGVAGDIAGELTEKMSGGTMTFRLHMIDAISLMDGNLLMKRASISRL